MSVLLSITVVGLVLVGIAMLVSLFNRVSGWTRASRIFGPPPVPTACWTPYATCIVPLGRFPVSVGACERGLVIRLLFPLSFVTPTLWAPWDEIELEGPRWHWGTYEDVVIGGLRVALPRPIGDRIRGAQRGWKRLDETV